jgi:hypothetical protein
MWANSHPSFHLSCTNLLGLFSSCKSPLLAPNLQPPLAVMASALSSSCLQLPEDLRKLRKSIASKHLDMGTRSGVGSPHSLA